jgi:hypothetical protein
VDSKRLILGASALLLLGGCGGGVRRFPLRAPVWRDADLDPIPGHCSPDPEKPKKKICGPSEYESSFAWDAADNTVFRPLSRFLAVDPGGPAVNVNSMDEVPNSSWFVNRLGTGALSQDDIARGYCDEKVLDPEHDKPGSWVIDQGKANGANPGFRINVEGAGRFMLKSDPTDQPERATGADAIATRFYYASGWWVPCVNVVYVRPELLKLKPGLKVTDNSGVTKDFNQKALDEILAKGSHRNGLVRMEASRWLPGRTVGPFTYAGTKWDDPNDVIPHEDRRDLRGARVIAAWLNHFDSREQNSMQTWMPDEKNPEVGHVQHWYIDLGDCFGSEWEWEGISKRLGHAYYLDIPYVAEDFITLGFITRPWDRARRSRDGEIFGFFNARDFDPDKWRGGYPNPTFNRMDEHDAAWATRIIARFTLEDVQSIVAKGDYTETKHTNFLVAQLLLRQEAILKRYFAKLSPITDLKVSGAQLCGTDLAKKTGTYFAEEFRYRAHMRSGTNLEAVRPLATPAVTDNGNVCASLVHVAADGGVPDDAPERYVVVDLENGKSRGPLRAHLYDLGPKQGFRLVGIERPDETSSPD